MTEPNETSDDSGGPSAPRKPSGEKSPEPDSYPLPAPSDSELTIVGIGASAGGLAALRTFFEHVPEDSGLAYVIVVHLSPEHESHLAQLLQPHVRMPVQQVTQETPLEPNAVYVIPPNANLNTIDTHLRLSSLEERRRERAPIDHFFRTLARTHHHEAVAVILTGTGSDGTLGIKEIKEKGGLTIVQDPAEAEYDGMPQSAVATGIVDLILPLDAIPNAILRYVSVEPRLPIPDDDEEVRDTERQLLQKVFAQLRAHTGRDFSRYKRSTILRRIQRRMQLRSIVELGDYLTLLREQHDEVRDLADDLLITVTNFFRDREVFEALEKDVIPTLFEEKGADDDIRVWSVGCATGEEAYSLTMLLMEAAARHEKDHGFAPRLQIFASDLHERSLTRAREGFYPGDIETDVSAERLKRFFHKEDGGFRIRKEVREMVVFAPHNLLGDPPFSKLDLIACRNVMIYLQRDVQQDVIELFHYALRPDGFLVVGTSETVDNSSLFRTESKKVCLYRKRNVPAPEPRLPVFPLTRTRLPGRPEWDDRAGEPVVYGMLHQQLVERYAPPSVLVSPDDRVVHVSEHAGRYLVYPGGEPTTSVFKLVRPELRIELRAALHAARKREQNVRTKPLSAPVNGRRAHIVLYVRPAPHPSHEGFCLVIFDEHDGARDESRSRDADEQAAAPPSAQAEAGAEATKGAGQRELEAELDLSHQRLQAVIQEYETGQEELKASNEELQSANEELRSTLEELETSKEELQSMNEELQTVNQENRHKVAELDQLSGDLQNLMASTQIATLFLDRTLRILRFTPRIGELFNVRPADRGRPLSDLTHRLGYDELQDVARRVLDRLVPVEREVEDEEGRWYLTRVLPYRSTQDRIDGVVITFVEITARREAEDALRRSEEQFRGMAETVPDVLFTATSDGTIDYVSRQIETLAHVSPDALVGTFMWPGLVHPEDRDETDAAWAHAVEHRERFELRFRFLQPNGSACWVIVRARPMPDATGGAVRWFGAITDVDALTEAEREVQSMNEELERRVEERTREVRALAARLATAEQEERARISHLLHDDLQQQLFGLAMTLEVLRRARSEEEGAELHDQAKAILTQASDLTRSLALELSPPVLASPCLEELLTWIARQKEEQHGMAVDVDVEASCEVPSHHARVILFRGVWEVLFNVVKHAGTREARLRGWKENGAVIVHVEDDGDGFDVAVLEEQRSAGFGLNSVRERLTQIGGRLEIVSSDRGTRVTLVVPSER